MKKHHKSFKKKSFKRKSHGHSLSRVRKIVSYNVSRGGIRL